ncbi:hypothetical protein M2138_000254 [Dysgonomonadaceae bacterium PH5-43]|nr:hypothetical protein [Dysgonomonadaceae bacterium PH5-43]
MQKTFLIICLFIAMVSCNKETKQNTEVKMEVTNNCIPTFNADSAYNYTAQQVAFGPRVPNSKAHKACANYFISEFKKFGAEVIEQDATLRTYDNIALEAKNIIASFNLENKNRILLCAHWDSRPFADHDSNPDNHKTPIDGANDSAGSCGILMEIARQIGINNPTIGVDIILFDAEDWGVPKFENKYEGGWCLGSKYWAANPHTQGYTAKYGILLDMASAKNARFYKETVSMYYASDIVKKVWQKAHELGYEEYFVNKYGGSIEDDHVPVNQIRKIPCIDIIQSDPNSQNGFGSYWHTVDDNMDAVSKETIKAVGETITHIIYNEK